MSRDGLYTGNAGAVASMVAMKNVSTLGSVEGKLEYVGQR